MANVDASVSTRVISEGRIRPEPRQAVLMVDVVIPAFNEGACIEGVLHDVTAARQHDWFQVQNIYVISDASTDETDDIVRQVATTEPRIKLIRKQERQGKQDSINLALSITQADVVVFIDADVRLANEQSIAKLIQPFRDGGVALVQGGLVRAHPGFTINPAKLAAYFDWIVVDKVRRRKAMSWWSIDGRVMALSRDFYKGLLLPSSLADDQFIFYSCIKQGRKFVWAEDAVFYYGPPQSIRDFSRQWSRYFFYTRQSEEYFGKELMEREMSLPRLWRTILSSLVRYPFHGLAWLLCYGISHIEYMLRLECDRYARGLFWTESKPIEVKNSGLTCERVVASPKWTCSSPESRRG
mgnify:CR=1 FL=1